MGKRQVIYKGSQIRGNRDLIDREVNLVTTEQRVWHGTITAVDQGKVEFKDSRFWKHSFEIGNIDKIYTEVVTDY